MEDLQLKTKDGFILTGTYFQAGNQKAPTVLLLHQMRRDRSTWTDFAVSLRDLGWHVLTLDIRGHGKSTHFGNVVRSYKDFGLEDFENIHLDVDAALQWLKLRREVNPGSLALGGASITANITIQRLANTTDFRCGVALSPGLNYHGLTIKKSITALQAPLCLIATADDPRQPGSELDAFCQRAYPNLTCQILPDRIEHGTDILLSCKDIAPLLRDFLAQHLTL